MTNKNSDYTSMSGPELLRAVGLDAAKWEAAFCQIAKKLGHNIEPDGWMLGWFANAIEQAQIRAVPKSKSGIKTPSRDGWRCRERRCRWRSWSQG